MSAPAADVVIMYERDPYQFSDGPPIRALEVTKATEHFVTVRRYESYSKKPFMRRQSRDGVYATWEECRTAMATETARKLQYARDEVSRLASKLRDIEELKEPK